jgi:DNA mismatch repair protein MSH4
MYISMSMILTVSQAPRFICCLPVLTKRAVQYEMQAELRYDNSRRYWLRIAEISLDGRAIPDVLVNQYRKKGFLECQTLDLMKLNQRIEDSHQEVVLMSDKTIQALSDSIRGEIPRLFRVCESVAMLDMIAAFR